MTLRRYLGHLKNTAASLRTKLAYAPGHFYSAICDPDEVRLRYQDPAHVKKKVELPGIDLQEIRQLDRWNDWREVLRTVPFPYDPTPTFRYHFNNAQYGAGDAIPLFCMIGALRPKRIVEIGCGFSSMCILDSVEHFRLDTECTFIDPHPELLYNLIRPRDRPNIIPKKAQDVPLTIFDQLSANDILMIDSTHVLKTCSDVTFELFEVLPRLSSGVFIQFHDIFYPFEYNVDWVLVQNYSWNEIYAIRAFLMYNARFRVEFWNDYLLKTSPEIIDRNAPSLRQRPGGSLWLSVTGCS